MIQLLPDAPANVAAFTAQAEVTAADFTSVILPHCEKKVEHFGELNYLLQLKDDVPGFTAGAWVQDMLLGLKHITKWNRCAIVTDKEAIHSITDVFSKLVPGEFRGFRHEQLKEALDWCSNDKQIN